MKAPAYCGDAIDVPVADGGHRHHEEVHAVPVAELLAVGEVRWVAGVLQLQISQANVLTKAAQKLDNFQRWHRYQQRQQLLHITKIAWQQLLLIICLIWQVQLKIPRP